MAPGLRFALVLFAAPLLAAGLSGCFSETVEGDRTTFAFAGWATLGTLVVPAAALGIARATGLSPSGAGRPRFVLAAAIVGVITLYAVVSMAVSRVTVAPDGVHVRWLGWIGPHSRDVPFAGLAEIGVDSRRLGHAQRGRSRRYSLVWRTIDGTEGELQVGYPADRLLRPASATIAARFKAARAAPAPRPPGS